MIDKTAEKIKGKYDKFNESERERKKKQSERELQELMDKNASEQATINEKGNAANTRQRDQNKNNQERRKEDVDNMVKTAKIYGEGVDGMADVITNATIKTTIDVNWQKEVVDILAAETSKLPSPIQSAAMVIERKSGTVKAYVGSAKYGTIDRKGSINYLTAIRSPGSTLKPLIFGIRK